MTMFDTLRDRPMHVAPPLAPTDFDMPDPSLPRIRRLEALAARAWPSRETVFDGTWAVRVCDHDTKRQNSIVPLDPNDSRDLDARIERARDRLLDASRRPTFRLTPLAAPRIDHALEDLGWDRIGRTHVMVADLAALPPLRAAPSDLCRRLWIERLEAMGGVSSERRCGLARTIERIATGTGPAAAGTGPAHLHSVSEDANPAAAALAVHIGRDVGLMEVFTDPGRRGRGHARRVVTQALATARARGASRAWLQVEVENAPAIALYRSLGFSVQYDYHYRVAPAS